MAEGSWFRVCKTINLDALSVSQKMVYNIHQKKDPSTGMAKEDKRGQHARQSIISDRPHKFVPCCCFTLLPCKDQHEVFRADFEYRGNI